MKENTREDIAKTCHEGCRESYWFEMNAEQKTDKRIGELIRTQRVRLFRAYDKR